MRTTRSRGFTLIELLTVIAIISILASLTAVTLPRVLEKAKITRAEADLKAIEKALTTFATEHGSFPPAKNFRIYGPDDPDPLAGHIVTDDYLKQLNLNDVKDIYDRFSESTVPFVYIPVNVAQVNKVKKYLDTQANKSAKYYAKGISLTDATAKAANLKLSPPTTYDAYVLLSVGPGGSKDYGGICVPDGNGGIVGDAGDTVDDGTGAPQPAPEVTGLRAYIRATRDANDNKDLDFDYRTRTQKGEGKQGSYADPLLFHLPGEVDDSGAAIQPNTLYGPMIFAPSK